MKKIFQANVNIYLQGRDALTDGKLDKKSGLYTKFLIGAHSDLILEDNRSLGWNCADQFNVPSQATIFYDDRKERMKIVLTRPESQKPPIKTLLFGVIYNGTIPVYDVELEVFKTSTVEKGAIPFVTLINQS